MKYDPKQWVRSEMFFGRSIQYGDADEPIPADQLKEFLTTVVTPLFPDGLTWMEAHGQYYSSAAGRIVEEDSIYVILLSPLEYANGDDGHFDKLTDIADAYVDKFNQSSVLIVSGGHVACFAAGETHPSACDLEFERRRLMHNL